MTIKTFLDEVRFKTYTDDIVLPFDRSTEVHSSLMVQLKEALKRVEGLKGSTEYSINNLHGIKRDVDEIFKKINSKIDILDNLAEGYQYLNTNELDNDAIHSLKIFNLKDRYGYNDITQSLTLNRLNKIRELKPTSVKKDNLQAEELYKITGTYRDSLIGIVRVSNENTEILKAELLDVRKDLLSTLLVSNGRVLGNLPEDVRYIKVYTNNVDKDGSNYTTLSILENKYDSYHSVIVGEGIFEKKGSLLKVVIDSKVPTESYLILDLNISYQNKYTNELEEYTLTFNGITSREILVDKNTVKGKVLDLDGNEVESSRVIGDYVLVKEKIDKALPIVHLGNKVFDISGIRSDTFQVSLKVSMYNTIDNTKTPEIKGIFAYVTER